MILNQGQRVRIRGKQFEGIVEKKLVSLDDVYVVKIECALLNEEKLVRGDDLEVLADVA